MRNINCCEILGKNQQNPIEQKSCTGLKKFPFTFKPKKLRFADKIECSFKPVTQNEKQKFIPGRDLKNCSVFSRNLS